MDVVWLESLLALTAHGSFSRAAAELHVSQPAFSRRIRSLEQWIGAELVDRSAYPVALTPAGVKLHRRAVQVVSGLAAAREEIRGAHLTPTRSVRVAATHTLATHYFATWWQQLAMDPTELTCMLQALNTLEAYDALMHGGCDLVLAYADPLLSRGVDGNEAESLKISEERFAPYSRAVGGRPVFSLPGTEGHPVPYVNHRPGAFLGRVTDRILVDQHLHLRPVVQADLTSALADLVHTGIGIGWLPATLASTGVSAGSLARVDGTWTADLEIRLYRRSGAGSLSPQAEALWLRTRKLAERDP